MAFGDITQSAESYSTSSATTHATTFGSTPASGALLVATHMTGATTSDGCASGGNEWTSSLRITNATEADETEIYHRIAEASEATEVTATGSGSDEHGLILIEFDGGTNGWKAEGDVLDVAEADARDASGTTFAVGPTAETAQNNEVGVAAVYTRSLSNNDDTAWTNSYVGDLSRVGASSAKSIAVATKVLTTTGAQSTTHTFENSAVSQGGLVTYMEAAAGGDGTDLPWPQPVVPPAAPIQVVGY